MNPELNLRSKILNHSDLVQKVKQWKADGEKVVFTNGCFDIVHVGHIASLIAAAKEGSKLVVAINSDESVRLLKGPERPLNDESSRALILAALLMVDAVTVFHEPTPLELIRSILPDVLVKGGDYRVEDIAGAKEVIENGGKIVLNPIIEGYSTTTLVNRIRS